MKISFPTLFITALSFFCIDLHAQTFSRDSYPRIRGGKQPYIDICRFGPRKVEFETVARTHVEDIAVQGENKATLKSYRVDEEEGFVNCLSSPGDTGSIKKPYGEVIKVLPGHTCPLKDGIEDHFPGMITAQTT